MLIGLLSEWHGDAERTARAVKLLIGRGAKRLIHCGDIGSTTVLAELAEAGLPVDLVPGNVDMYDNELQQVAASLALTMHGESAELEIEGARIAITHGHNERLYRTILMDQKADYLFTGHTHVVYDERQGKVRVINPGAVYRANPSTVAILDLATGRLEFLPFLILAE